MASDQLLDPAPTGDAQSQPKAKIESHQSVIRDGYEADNVAEVKRGLDLAASRNRKTTELLAIILGRCVPEGSLHVIKYLIDEEHAPLSRISPDRIPQCPLEKIPRLLQLLINRGWDINQHDVAAGGRVGKCLLQHICYDESLVRWCLDHGSKLEGIRIDPYYSPPLLECVALSGSVSTFKLLQSRGAEITSRMLHQAVEGGSLQMVQYLVEEVSLSVNASDDGDGRPNFWGTPLCYAAHWAGGRQDIVRYLLEKGADPSLRSPGRDDNAIIIAEGVHNRDIIEVLREWKEQHQEK